MSSKQTEQVATALRAKVGVIWIRTAEEQRVQRELAPLADAMKYMPLTWTVTGGLRELTGDADGQTKDPSAAIASLLKRPGRALGMFRDLGSWLNDPVSKRTFKDAHQAITTMEKDQAKQIVVIDPGDPPKDVLGLTTIDWNLPDREDCARILAGMIEWAPETAKADAAKNGNGDAIVSAMIGLAAEDAANALSRSLAETGTFDLKLVSAEKARLVRGTGLEWYEPDPRGMDGVGGLENLKSWLENRKTSFSKKARDYGLPAPKGALLLGIPGCGKSLTAKCVAAAWKMPLLRLDVGALFTKYVGDSEGKIRDALRTAEAIAPCVLWIDEVEKAFGSGGGEQDGGTSGRVFGTFLTWMQERKPGVFLLATSNDVTKLPSAFLRAGRWDAMWFVDLPTRDERLAITEVMLRKFDHCSSVAGNNVADACDGYTGAEIEQAFSDALYKAFEDGARNVTTKDVVASLAGVVPLSTTMAEELGDLRDWAKGRARPASMTEVAKGRKAREIK